MDETCYNRHCEAHVYLPALPQVMNGRVPSQSLPKNAENHDTSNVTNSCLLSLPPELRLQIYEYLLLNWHPYQKYNDNNQPTIAVNILPYKKYIRPSVKQLGIPIFAVCRQLYFEARPVFLFWQVVRLHDRFGGLLTGFRGFRQNHWPSCLRTHSRYQIDIPDYSRSNAGFGVLSHPAVNWYSQVYHHPGFGTAARRRHPGVSSWVEFIT